MFPDGSTTALLNVNNFITVNSLGAMVDVDSDIVTSNGVWGEALTPSYRAMYYAIKLKTTNTDIGVPTVS